MTSAASATMTCKRLSSLISLARALATPSNAFRFRAWRSLSTAVIELAKASSLPVFAIALQEELLNAAVEGQIFSSWKTAPADFRRRRASAFPPRFHPVDRHAGLL